MASNTDLSFVMAAAAIVAKINPTLLCTVFCEHAFPIALLPLRLFGFLSKKLEKAQFS